MRRKYFFTTNHGAADDDLIWGRDRLRNGCSISTATKYFNVAIMPHERYIEKCNKHKDELNEVFVYKTSWI